MCTNLLIKKCQIRSLFGQGTVSLELEAFNASKSNETLHYHFKLG